MSKTVVVWSCGHADPSVNNDRFSYLGSLLYDLKPDYCLDLGDGADLRSLNSFDTKSPKAIVAESYERDIESYLDSQERLRHKFKKHKRKLPTWYGFAGNHEYRLDRAISLDPRLEGSKYGISKKHLETNRFFNEYHDYENSAPSIANYDGIDYAHFFNTGNSPNAASGIHHAYTLLQKRHVSSICGHSHFRNMYFSDGMGQGKGIAGLVVGCMKGKEESWAGQGQLGWWKGAVILRSVEGGYFDPEFVSLDTMERLYKDE